MSRVTQETLPPVSWMLLSRGRSVSDSWVMSACRAGLSLALGTLLEQKLKEERRGPLLLVTYRRY